MKKMGCEDCISISREFLVIDIFWENRGIPFVYTGTLGLSLKLLGHLGLPRSASLGGCHFISDYRALLLAIAP